MPYPPEMLEQIRAARREKIANKTRERERERRGEMTNRLLKRTTPMIERPLPVLVSTRSWLLLGSGVTIEP